MIKVDYKEAFLGILGAVLVIVAIGVAPLEKIKNSSTNKGEVGVSDYEKTVNEILSVIALSSEVNEPVGSLFEEYYSTHSSSDMSVAEKNLLDQARRRLDGAGVSLRIPTVEGVNLYSMQGGDGYGGYFWVLWLSEERRAGLVGNPDITINFPVEDPSVLMVRTEKFMVDGEDQPLVRGYLIENGFANPTVGPSPVFVEYK
ncbi:hypothetical protein KC842_02075 [Candidatus Nomurabacteria bacterium]|nr:hypothetical protein [Candidatus Nomurabacteria bacterium]USN94895.1 MAG: hypothetical protein H6791_00505 [Candidatus Nomurabacteria bacterium]